MNCTSSAAPESPPSSFTYHHALLVLLSPQGSSSLGFHTGSHLLGAASERSPIQSSVLELITLPTRAPYVTLSSAST